ncbi:MAG: polysaccharide pyruvyl transferase family protein [bacterium]|nr:polysaccharide pyruvyl transferase family protein [bacterium]MCM1376587.1 polysaccharide pyruvyl transferase family protein [Muribaculum sp.]
MRAAVITLHTVCNYGTQLQAYATQEKLREYFEEVEFIPFKRSDTYGKGLLETFTRGNPLKALPIIPTMLRWKTVFGRFQKQHLRLGDTEYLREEDFRTFQDIYDAYFVGSDQVWNCGWNRGVIPPYYLSFAPDNKPKYAFSSSFGQKQVDACYVEQSKALMQRFDYITVREQSGVQILDRQYGYTRAKRILDPTLLMDGDFWRRLAPKNRIRGKYILIYNLQRNRTLDAYAERVSRETGYSLYRFCTRYDQIVRNGKSLLIPDVLSFITLIDNAALVITDSFHATAFCMNLHTEPLCIYPTEYEGRIAEFLELVGEEERHVRDYEDMGVLNRQIDFEKVDLILKREREKADEVLKTELGLKKRREYE